LGILHEAKASGPGDADDYYDIGGEPYYEMDNIDSIRRNSDTESMKVEIKNQDGTAIINEASQGASGIKFGCDVTPHIQYENNPYLDNEIEKVVFEDDLIDEEVEEVINKINVSSLYKMHKTNNLIRKPGSAVRAKGQYAVITGQVLDRDCLPISNAVIKIWQTDTAGNYIDAYTLQSDWEVMSPDYDKNFAYSGSTQTNNLGEYTFLTVLPVSKDEGLAPHVNFTIKHSDFQDIHTRMYFNKHPKNSSDTALNSMGANTKNLIIAKGQPIDKMDRTKGREYKFNITLEGINKYRRY
jgi:protocatechuate 3,4-dioxygenase beta subunit